MTDRELLEAAAKAAGIAIDKSPFNGGVRENTGFDFLGNAVLDWHNGTKWNPLTDDGDALRLAVKLDIDISWLHEAAGINRACKAISVDAGSPWELCVREEIVSDKLGATRRAIVRAAAEIGKGAAK